MTAINFPSSPSNGDTFVAGSVTYTYNSTKQYWDALPTAPLNTNFFTGVTKHITPGTDNTYDLGSSTHKWRSLYVDAGTINIGSQTIKATSSGIQLPELTIGTGTTTVKLGVAADGSVTQTSTVSGTTAAATTSVALTDLSATTASAGTAGLAYNNATGAFTYTPTDISAKANIAGPTFTGVPAAPTASAATNTTQLATTAFVATAVAGIVDSAPGTLNTLNEIAAALGDDANYAASTTTAIAAKAPLAAPTFTGVPAAPTASAGTNTTQLATTAFVTAATAGSGGSGGSIDLVADGAIAAGKAVTIEAGTGKVKQVTSTTHSVGDFNSAFWTARGVSGTLTQASQDYPIMTAKVIVDGSKIHVFQELKINFSGNGGYKVYHTQGTVSGVDITWSSSATEATAVSAALDWYYNHRRYEVAVVNDKIMISYFSSNQWKYVSGTSGASAATFTSAVSMGSTYSNIFDVKGGWAYQPTNGDWLYGASNGSTQVLVHKIASPYTGAPATTVTDTTSSHGGRVRGPFYLHTSGGVDYSAILSSGTSEDHGIQIIANTSGTITYGTRLDLNEPASHYAFHERVIWDPINSKIVLMAQSYNGADKDKIYMQHFTHSGTALTSTGYTAGVTVGQQAEIFYDTDNNIMRLIHAIPTGSSGQAGPGSTGIAIRTVDTSGNTPSISGSSTTLVSGYANLARTMQGWASPFSTYDYADRSGSVRYITGDVFIFHYVNSQSSSWTEPFQVRSIGGLSNKAQWVGISTAAVSNGDTATITLPGGINENQSGMTIEGAYYVQSNGDITTSVTDYKAGVALTAAKILVDDNTVNGATSLSAYATTSALTTGLAAKAPLAGPTFTGVPAAPTASVGTNTTQLATTAFVLANGSSGTTYNAISGNTTAVAGNAYIVDTGAAVTLTLPSSATMGDIVSVIDGTGTAATNNITIGRNSHKIQGDAADMTVSLNRAAFELVYYNATHGWLLTKV